MLPLAITRIVSSQHHTCLGNRQAILIYPQHQT